jgi:hypothetical protein
MVKLFLKRQWKTNADGLLFWATCPAATLFFFYCIWQTCRFMDSDWLTCGLIVYFTVMVGGGFLSSFLMKRRHKKERILREMYFSYREHVDALREELGVKQIFDARLRGENY